MHLSVKQQLQLIKRESGLSMAAICTEYGKKRQEKQTPDHQKYSLSFDTEGFSTRPGTLVKMVAHSIGHPDLNPLDFCLWGTRKV